MRKYGIKQPVVCCIINRATTIRIIWKSDSDSKSVDFHRQFFSGFLSEQVGRYPLSGMCFLIWRIIPWTNAMGSDSGISLPRVYKFFVHESQDDSNWMCFGWLLNLLFWFRCSIKSVFDYNHQWWICFTTSLNHKLVFFNFSWDGLDSLFGPQWPWFFRWCRWIIWLLRLLWFFNL